MPRHRKMLRIEMISEVISDFLFIIRMYAEAGIVIIEIQHSSVLIRIKAEYPAELFIDIYQPEMIRIGHVEPMATPPARAAFAISSTSILPRISLENT